jgi:hypothetical protein
VRVFLLRVFKLFHAIRSSLASAPIMPDRELRGRKQRRRRAAAIAYGIYLLRSRPKPKEIDMVLNIALQ